MRILTKKEALAAADAAERFPAGIGSQYWISGKAKATNVEAAALKLKEMPELIANG